MVTRSEESTPADPLATPEPNRRAEGRVRRSCGARASEHGDGTKQRSATAAALADLAMGAACRAKAGRHVLNGLNSFSSMRAKFEGNTSAAITAAFSSRRRRTPYRRRSASLKA